MKEAIHPRGLRDDTTCIVVDILPPEKLAPSPPTKRQGKIVFNNMFRRKHTDVSFILDREYAEPDEVEEIFDDGSAMLSKRYYVNQLLITSSLGVGELRALWVIPRRCIYVLNF